MNIHIPNEVKFIIDTLEENGFEAYVVGGCVRDAVLGNVPDDWDICTSALPEQTASCFEGYHIFETGLQHGTITLRLNHKSFEITTYRVDGTYSDNRRPDNVEFTRDLKNDLSRRDFTINAMAYNPRVGIVDYFDGTSDLQERIIRCVGDADTRFQEDALRIMRALRFASALSPAFLSTPGHKRTDPLCRPEHKRTDPLCPSELPGFSIEKSTSDAIIRNKELLNNIAVERIAVELNKLIVGTNVGEILLSYTPVFEVIIPELSDMVGFNQNSSYHHLDVWGHTVESVINAPKDVALRLTMLFHDIAKPQCYTEVDSVGHFYGHPQVSSDMAREILNRLKYDNDTIKTVTTLILYHNTDFHPSPKHIKRWLNKIGEEKLRQLIDIIKADSLAKSEYRREAQLLQLEEVLLVLDEIIEEQQCFSLKDLAVDGRDLIAIGITEGTEIGTTLKKLLELVINEDIENEKDALLRRAFSHFST